MKDQPTTPENVPQWALDAANAIGDIQKRILLSLNTPGLKEAFEVDIAVWSKIIAAHAPQPSAEAGKLADRLMCVKVDPTMPDKKVLADLQSIERSAGALRARDSAGELLDFVQVWLLQELAKENCNTTMLDVFDELRACAELTLERWRKMLQDAARTATKEEPTPSSPKCSA